MHFQGRWCGMQSWIICIGSIWSARFFSQTWKHDINERSMGRFGESERMYRGYETLELTLKGDFTVRFRSGYWNHCLILISNVFPRYHHPLHDTHITTLKTDQSSKIKTYISTCKKNTKPQNQHKTIIIILNDRCAFKLPKYRVKSVSLASLQ